MIKVLIYKDLIMPKDCNPFNSQTYSSPEVFVDRDGIVNKIVQGLSNTANDNPENFLIIGKRGIGKSSTIQYVKRKLIENIEYNYRFLSILIKLKKDNKKNVLIQDIEKGVRKEVAKINVYESTKNHLHNLWGYVSEFQIMGNGLKTNQDKLHCNDISKLAELLSNSSSKAKLSNENIKSGILIIIDEADNAPDNLELGEFLKLLFEAIQDEKCENICFMVSGLPVIEDKLLKSHHSTDRLFSKLELKDLDENETSQLLKNGIRNANRKRHTNSYTRTITMEDSIMKEIYTMTKGKPYLVQKLASSMYNHAKEDKISLVDLKNCHEYLNMK